MKQPAHRISTRGSRYTKFAATMDFLTGTDKREVVARRWCLTDNYLGVLVTRWAPECEQKITENGAQFWRDHLQALFLYQRSNLALHVAARGRVTELQGTSVTRNLST
ncbi:MAG: hypothetical protein ACLPQ6_03360 [Steroidobacteraceae bacterium]